MNPLKKELLKKSVKYPLIFILIFWFIQLAGYVCNIDFSFMGIFPRTIEGLPGIITAPFIHANFQHLLGNTLPFCILSCLLILFYKEKAPLIFILIWITGGVITWLIGRPAWHIGASSVIYGLASFLFFGGIISWNPKLMLVSIIVLIFYSGLVWGIFPNDRQVSWEGHLSGALVGLLWAYVFRKSLT